MPASDPATDRTAINLEARIAMYRKQFGENLTALLALRKLTAKSVADKLGVSPQALSHYMAGRHMPEGEYLCVLADILNVSIDALVGRAPFEISGEPRKKPDGEPVNNGA